MRRIIPGLALAACWLLLLLSGHYPIYYLTIILISVIAGFEYLKMVMDREVGLGDIILLTSILSLPVVMTGLWQTSGLHGGLFFSFFLLVCYILSIYKNVPEGFPLLTNLVFGLFYTGFLVAHLLLLWQLPEGNLWLIILVTITAGSDSGAYYCGKTFGKNKLCPHVSPNKTVEGAIGGLLSGVAAAVLFAWILLDAVNWVVLIPMAMLLTCVGIIGDLCESIVKRGTKTKDSGRILLGHGGVLDRIDSMVMAAPLLYYILIFVG